MPRLRSLQVVLGGALSHFLSDQRLSSNSKSAFAHGHLAEEFEATPSTLHFAVLAHQLANLVGFAPISNNETLATVDNCSVVLQCLEHLVSPHPRQATELSLLLSI